MLLSLNPYLTSKPTPPHPLHLPPSRPVLTLSSQTLPSSAIRRIADKLRNLGYLQTPSPPPPSDPHIFLPTPRDLPASRVGHTLDASWSSPHRPVPGPGSGDAIMRFHELRREVEEERERRRKGKGKGKGEEAPMAAELLVPEKELKRLRGVGIRLDKRLKVGKAGITEGIVNGIHERWRKAEVVKIKCEDLCRMNMKRTHEILERKTGGLVIWRSGSVIILYRGANYKYPYFNSENLGEDGSVASSCDSDECNKQEDNLSSTTHVNSSPLQSNASMRRTLVNGVGSPKKLRFQLPGEAQLEEEADQLLNGLGPRFSDWWGYEPLPVDADLLPAIVHGYRRPFRLLPYGVMPKLTDREMTILRRLSRPLPCHFALGRNRNLQGLAASMIKLWEKCEIAKIAIKRGVRNTNNELMVEELKRLTGGTLLSRDTEFIVFYRGKDFLPPAVSKAIEERRNSGIYQENLRTTTKSFNISGSNLAQGPKVPSVEKNIVQEKKTNVLTGGPKSADTLDAKLSRAYEKKMKAEKLLEELESTTAPSEMECDKEAISEEERYMLRKVGLRMDPFLLLGRRGVFDGTIENMHLHWKYRELVKLISKDRSIHDIHQNARTLEAASGGILVAVERVNKGHAIIVYRGKNYRRPTQLRPQTLLNKRAALRRYQESQRSESLKLHVLKLSEDIERLKDQMVKPDTMTDSLESSKCSTTMETLESVTTSAAKEASDNRIKDAVTEDEDCKADAAPCLQRSKLDMSFGDSEVNLSVPPTKRLSTVDSMEVDVLGKEIIQFSIDPRQNSSEPCSENKDVSTSSTSQVSGELIFNVLPNKTDSHVPRSERTDSRPEASFRASPLSNKERLILRKQALKMKKRPVLSVGRNNVVDGVAKTIKTHFRKHPLAIVNIKNIAKGTSVKEVIIKLERATGAVLVSREPSKVILYRGWNEGKEHGDVAKEKPGNDKASQLEDQKVSPQLMAAIKMECGLQSMLPQKEPREVNRIKDADTENR